MKPRRWIAQVVCAVSVIGLTGAVGCSGKKSRREAVKAFLPHMATYLETAGLSAHDGQPYVQGKVLPVDVDSGKPESRVYGHLKDDYRATSPEDVGTVALIECGEELVGHYLANACTQPSCEKYAAYRGVCTVTLVDRLNSINTGSGRVLGPKPPAQLASEKEWHGKQPRNAIASFIEQRPRR